MIGSANCVYETPCGWGSKWDKACDKKIASQNVKVEEDITKINKATCDHEWESYGISTGGAQYICGKCGKMKTEPVNYNNYTIIN